jgi:uncharacterized protein YukE
VTEAAAAGGGGGGGSWTPPASLRSWTATCDPSNSRFADDPVVQQARAWLLGANPGAFAALESQLVSTAELAGVTAKGLQDAQAASDWQGKAADAYRSTLSKLPKDLQLLNTTYADALSLLTGFATDTFQWQASFKTFLTELETQKANYQSAVTTSYPSKSTGMYIINNLQDGLTTLCLNGMTTLNNSIDAWQTLGSKVGGLASQAPHESDLDIALTPIRWIKNIIVGLYDDVKGTWGSIEAFANDPSWTTLGDMSKDLGVDASIVVLAAAAPEGLAAAGVVDGTADSSLLAITETIGDVGTGVGVGTGIDGAASDFGEGKYGAGVIDSVEAGLGVDGAIGSNELDDAIHDASLIDQYDADLSAGTGSLSSFSAAEQKTLKELIPDTADPAAVSAADKQINEDLTEARGGAAADALKDFLKDTFVTDPASDAAGQAIDGNKGGS